MEAANCIKKAAAGRRTPNLSQEGAMSQLNRRHFIQQSTAAVLAGVAGLKGTLAANRKMTMNLSPGAIGVSVNQRDAIELAAKYGFEAVEAYASYLASLSEDQLSELRALMKEKSIVFGNAALSVEFRKDDSALAAGMKALPSVAAGLKRAGVTRISTYIMPCHDSLTYLPNFKQHAVRLREVAKVLKDNDVRLGLEYVGPRTLLVSRRYPFIHTMAEMKDLIGEIGTGNVGLLVDSFHWWTSGDTEDDLLALRNEEVVSVDLNDGQAGVSREQQIDSKRELPTATGVIDLGVFLNALNKIGYDGPVRVEPFNKALNALPKDESCAATAKALKQAFSLIR
jgi:sugar phosphate isomerase/epimerase